MPTDAKGRFFGIKTDCCGRFRRGEDVNAAPIPGTSNDWSFACLAGRGCNEPRTTEEERA